MKSQLRELSIFVAVASLVYVLSKSSSSQRSPPKTEEFNPEREAFAAESLEMLQHDLQEVRILAMRELGPLPGHPVTLRVMKLLDKLTAQTKKIGNSTQESRLIMSADATKVLAKLKKFIESLAPAAALHKNS
jgi:hypothetical protein